MSAKRNRNRLYLAAFSASLLYVSAGAVMAWTSPALKKINITEEDGVWLASLYGIGAAFGPTVNALCLDTMGRKVALLVHMVSFLGHWVLLGVSSDLGVMYLARVVGGLGVGGAFAGVSVYIAEISDEEVRGALGSMQQFFLTVGFLLEYCLGPWVSWDLLLILSGLAALIFGLLFSFMPESPHYLLAKGQRARAQANLAWLRSAPPFAIQRELTHIEESLEEARKSGGGKLSDLMSGAGMRALLMCLGLMLVQQGSGYDAVVGYTQEVLELAAISLPPAYGPILLGLVSLAASAGVPPLAVSFGLKKLLVVSALGMAVSLVVLAGYFFDLKYGFGASKVNFLPVMSLIAYNIFFCVGLGPVPWTIVGEMFAARVKGLACSAIAFAAWMLTFAVITSYGSLAAAVGPAPVFAAFALVLLLGALGMSFLLPETKGLTLQEIQDLLSGTKASQEKCDRD